MHKILPLLIFLFFTGLKMTAKIIEVSLDYKIENSPSIIEGQILHAISKHDQLKTTLCTNFTVKIISVSKGTTAQKHIIIRNLGRTVGGNTLQVCPNSYFDIGDVGVYFNSKIADGIPARDAINGLNANTNPIVLPALASGDVDTFDTTIKLNNTSDGLHILHFTNLGATSIGLTNSNITSCFTADRNYLFDVDLAFHTTNNFNYTAALTTS